MHKELTNKLNKFIYYVIYIIDWLLYVCCSFYMLNICKGDFAKNTRSIENIQSG